MSHTWNPDELAESLRNVLPPVHHDMAGRLAHSLHAQRLDSSFTPILEALAGQTVQSSDVHVTFGSGDAFGMVWMSDPTRKADQPYSLQINGSVNNLQQINLNGGHVDAVIGQQTVVHPPPQSKLSPQEQRDRRAMLQKIRSFWVDGQLSHSLAEVVQVELQLTEQPDAVHLPLRAQYQELQRPPRDIPSGTKIADLFYQSGHALLILGAPGAGKTTLLLELCRDLLTAADQDEIQPIPVIFNLSPWQKNSKSLDSWLVTQLRNFYSVPKAVGKRWLTSNALIILLDGLDEVAEDARTSCVAAINEYRKAHLTKLALCSRDEDYRALAVQLHLDAAVLIQPLDLVLVEQSLRRYGAFGHTLRAELAKDVALRKLMTTPLMLLIMRFVGTDGLLATHERDWATTLWNGYIHRMLRRRRAMAPSQKQKLLYSLRQIARVMIQQNQSIFLIERIQPQWLNAWWLFAIAWIGSITMGCVLLLLSTTLLGSIVGVLVTPWAVLSLDFVQGVGAFTIIGLFSGTLSLLTLVIAGVPGRAFLAEVEPFESIEWSSKGWFAGGIVWILVLIVLSLSVGFTSITVILSTIPAYAIAIGVGIRGTTKITTKRPNEGIRTALFVMFGVGLAAAIPLLFVGISALFGSLEGLIGGSVLSLLAVGIGLGVGMAKGGFSALKHGIIRLLLALSRKLPLNLRGHLDTGVERIILHRVGGGYIFMHRSLMEHIAAMSDETINQLSKKVDHG